MALVRRPFFLCAVLFSGALGLAGCTSAKSNRAALPLQERIDRALSAATGFLLDRQSPDGAWRSETYGAFKDGGSLTPLALQALLATPASDQRDAACHKGAAYLAAMVQPDGSIDAGPHGLSYPVYTAALAVQALSLSDTESHRRGRAGWLAFLRQRQLTEELGWQPTDREYGGWGFSSGLPRKPPPGEAVPPLVESNLSATVFALDALRTDGKVDDAIRRKALVFVQRCQNYCDDSKRRDPALDDGGFFFIYDDPVRNKAGVAGTDGAGRKRYRSYGSTTADGLRALLRCGLPLDHPRVVAARQWLEKHFSADSHPGAYAQDRASARPAVYYYYCYSLARAFKEAGVNEVPAGTGEVRWVEGLAEALLRHQREDGSWSNPAVAVREDDPVVASCLAVTALAACRAGTTGNADGTVTPRRALAQ
jgi:squalene-hopene/tetraprenyl-beta-curcumene cyclase